jgi:hypothetical protein
VGRRLRRARGSTNPRARRYDATTGRFTHTGSANVVTAGATDTERTRVWSAGRVVRRDVHRYERRRPQLVHSEILTDEGAWRWSWRTQALARSLLPD